MKKKKKIFSRNKRTKAKYYYLLIDLFKYFSLLFSICLIYKISFSYSKINFKPGKKFIFTFWEPARKIPGYLMLCIQTWKKFLPEYSIKVLDYSNLKDYLGESIFSRIICKEMTLPIQADAIRVAILKNYGGIWFDVDTIILGREFISELKDTKLAMFGEEMNKTQHIGFIYACKNNFLIYFL